MNKIVASVGLVALGAASVKAQSSISAPPPKWWNISATVRGFYDDNANTAPNGSTINGLPGGPSLRVNTWGYDLNPTVGINLGNQQTTFSAMYAFNYLYYARPLPASFNPVTGQVGSSDKSDQNHTFSMLLDHAFNQDYSIHVGDAFAIGQEPDLLRAGNAINAFYRISGNNIVNSGNITVNGQLTPVLGFEAGYNNGFYDYASDAIGGQLDRIENYAHLDARWTITPDTVGVLGYQFGYIDYTGNAQITTLTNPTGTNPIVKVYGDNVLNTMSHTVYVGADHTFLPELTGSIRAGGSYYDYVNDPNGVSDFGPYVQASLTYTYAPQSTATLGFQESRQASSLVQIQASSIIHDTETSVVYGTITHRIMPRLFGTIRGTFQNATYHGGGSGIDGQTDRFYEAGAELDYKFNPNFSVQAGYDYDRLDSSLSTAIVGPRDYDRNKFYIGATASY